MPVSGRQNVLNVFLSKGEIMTYQFTNNTDEYARERLESGGNVTDAANVGLSHIAVIEQHRFYDE